MGNNKTIAVIDLKAFYAYVECVDRGLDAWKTPLVVADKERGKNTIVLSVTPYLKSKGVPSRLRINDLPKTFDYIYAVPRMARYIEKSSEVVSIMLEFVAYEDIHVYSIDEAFIDLTSYLSYYQKSAKEIVLDIINRINEKTGLQATGGIGENMFLAKIALDLYAKKEKDGIAIMAKKDVPKKLWPIKNLTDIWGIGHGYEARLNAIGIFTIGDLAHSNRDYMHELFGIMGDQLVDMANGIDDSDMHEVYIPKEISLSIGQTLFKDYDKESIKVILRENNDDLCTRLRNSNSLTGLVHLFIGYSRKTGGGFSRQMSLLTPTDDNDILFSVILELLNKYVEDKAIRMIGISFGKLTNNINRQTTLFDDALKVESKHKLQKTMDDIQLKYGKNILLRASSLTENSTARERHNQIGGHRK